MTARLRRRLTAASVVALSVAVVIGMVMTDHAEASRRMQVTLHGKLDPATGMVTDVTLVEPGRKSPCIPLRSTGGLFCDLTEQGRRPLHQGTTP